MIKGSIEFAISDAELNFDDINNELKINPTKCVKKGNKVTESRYAPYDIWILKVKYDGEKSFEQELELFIARLIEKKEEIANFKSFYDRVCLNFYVRSDLGQLGFSLNPNIIQQISNLNIEANFHILSLGCAE